jgi:arylsulfatase
MIFYWPREIKNPGTLNSYPCHFIDIMPTLLSIAGASYPDSVNGDFIYPLAGESLLPAIANPGKGLEMPVFWQWSKGSAVLEDPWKIVKQGRDKDWELYNLEKDPCETKDLSEEYPEIVSRLDVLYHEWLSKYE